MFMKKQKMKKKTIKLCNEGESAVCTTCMQSDSFYGSFKLISRKLKIFWIFEHSFPILLVRWEQEQEQKVQDLSTKNYVYVYIISINKTTQK